MDKNNFKSFLRLQIVWKDEHKFELKVTASNGRFFGSTQVYDTPEPALKFAQTLKGFPQDNNDLHYETGYKNGSACFSMHFYCIDDAGHFGVEINLEDNFGTAYNYEVKNKIKIEIIVVQNAINVFQKGLSRLVTKQEGIAILDGWDDSVAN